MKRSEREFLKDPAPYRPFKTEQEEWADFNIHSKEEWRRHLKELFERDLYADLVDGCYIGTVIKRNKKQPEDY